MQQECQPSEAQPPARDGTATWAEFRRLRRLSRLAWAILAAGAFVVVGGLGWFFAVGQFTAIPPPDGPREARVLDEGWMKAVPSVRPVPAGAALALLDTLAVKGRAAGGDYNRSAFGQAWLDVDRNGCDTRNDILRRDLADVVFTEASRCQVAGGFFQEPYTGQQIVFRRGAESSKAVQIDHVVALGDAWQTGAQQLTDRQRQHLANDPLNLIAADGQANQDKSASDAASWLPPNRNFRCHYVARQVSVKAAYRLWVTPAEKDAMKRVLGSCPQQQTVVPQPLRHHAGG